MLLGLSEIKSCQNGYLGKYLPFRGDTDAYTGVHSCVHMYTLGFVYSMLLIITTCLTCLVFECHCRKCHLNKSLTRGVSGSICSSCSQTWTVLYLKSQMFADFHLTATCNQCTHCFAPLFLLKTNVICDFNWEKAEIELWLKSESGIISTYWDLEKLKGSSSVTQVEFAWPKLARYGLEMVLQKWLW